MVEPFALRAVWVLVLEGVAYKTILEHLSDKSQQLLCYNPVQGGVPVFSLCWPGLEIVSYWAGIGPNYQV